MISAFVPKIIIDRLASLRSFTAKAVAGNLVSFNKLMDPDPSSAVQRLRFALEIILDHALALKSSMGGGTVTSANAGNQGCGMGHPPPFLTGIETDIHNLKEFLMASADSIPDSPSDPIQRILDWYLNAVLAASIAQPRPKVLHGKCIPSALLMELLAIDDLVYEPGYRINRTILQSWYQRNPDIYSVAIDQETLKAIGYINAMPLNKTLYNRIKAGSLMDVTIPLDDILVYQPHSIYSLYFCSIAVHPAYHGLQTFRELYAGFEEKLMALAGKDIFVEEMIADVITQGGEKSARLAGMKPLGKTQHGSVVYSLHLFPFELTPISPGGDDLKRAYELKENALKHRLPHK